MKPTNLLFIMSDEHSKRVLGAYGNDVVQTPNMDALAAGGTLFENAYCNCPICVPSRASFATGRHVHEIGNWDNAFPYQGEPPSFGHALARTGHRCDSIGKLHYRSSDDPNGFDNEILPLHVLNGKGDLQGMLRSPPPKRPSTSQLAADAGPGESTYIRYDRDIRDAACALARGDGRRAAGAALDALRLLRLPALPAGGAQGVLRSLPAGPACRCPGSGSRRSSPTTRCSRSCARCSATRTASRTRTTSAPPSPPITAW